MLPVLLSILKIIGFVILGIVLFLILVLLLLLFCPFRYRIEGDNLDKMYGGVRISWLLSIVTLKIYYKDIINAYLKIFGIKIYDRAKKQSKIEKQDKLDSENENNSTDSEDVLSELDDLDDLNDFNNLNEEIDTSSESEVIEDTNKSMDDELVQDSVDNISDDEANSDKKDEEKKKSFIERLKELCATISKFFDELPDKIEAAINKPAEAIEDLLEKYYYYDKLLSSKGTQYVINFLKKEIVAILKSIRPRKAKIYLKISSEDDPALIAKCYEAIGMMNAFLPRNTRFEGGFEENDFRFDVYIKGYIILGPILIRLVKIYFNKKVRKFIKLMKREGK